MPAPRAAFVIRYDFGDIDVLGTAFGAAANEFNIFVHRNMSGLSFAISAIMQRQIRGHRVTGKLAGSVQRFYDPVTLTLEVGPTLKYGQYDAGLILQRGTKPISNLPFTPIRKWAIRRGLPAGPIWMKIKEKGVDAHPFLQETAERGDFKTAVENTAQRIGAEAIQGAMTKAKNWQKAVRQ